MQPSVHYKNLSCNRNSAKLKCRTKVSFGCTIDFNLEYFTLIHFKVKLSEHTEKLYCNTITKSRRWQILLILILGKNNALFCFCPRKCWNRSVKTRAKFCLMFYLTFLFCGCCQWLLWSDRYGVSANYVFKFWTRNRNLRVK